MTPHQFRTRNDFIKTQQTRSKSNKNAAKSTNLLDIPSLITVWLQVRVLPGPPIFSRALFTSRFASSCEAFTDYQTCTDFAH
jgi:hypothetical protein